MRYSTAISLLVFFVSGCTSDKKPAPLFEKIPSEYSGIQFTNQIENTKELNIFNYRNFYNGGGAAIGDVNNDGLPDIYFTGNMVKNKLYLNKGNFQFEDITKKVGVEGSKTWSTGVVMVDINHDGWLDIYVCNAGYFKGDNQKNELFINQGLQPGGEFPTFMEQAADYKLDEAGYTTHAAFFDYDSDGDLDCYILNNSFMPVNTLNYSNNRELYASDWPVKDFLKGGGDKLMRNDGGIFTDVTKEAGVYGSLIGFGLGITVGDVNGDHLPDMYVSNDFFERDYLYINQGDGTFTEEIENWMEHLSHASMGADMADLNNDGFPEIFVTEMLPSDEYRLKTTTQFENYSTYQLKQERGFYHQYMQNTLQLNNKNRSFSEIAFFAGVAASDWSWGALMFDADNDGLRDIYICNGIYQDVIDQDFINFFADEIVQKMVLTGEKEDMESVISKMPSNPVLNKVFRNRGDLTFEDVGEKWGITTPSFSNGAAYGDLDNDGDLDLVVNNLNMESFIFKNNANALGNHYLAVHLEGTPMNPFAIGAKVFVHKNGKKLNSQLFPTRGFQSSIDYKMIFGLGQSTAVDSLVVIWPDRQRSVAYAPPIDTTILIKHEKATGFANSNIYEYKNSEKAVVEETKSPFAAQKEDFFIDFYQEGLTMRMVSREGPKAAIADVDGDGLEDVFIGGASGQVGKLYLQIGQGFSAASSQAFENEIGFEDTAIAFFDANGDSSPDLFIGSGGNNSPAISRPMQDRIYLNDGKGNFTLSPSSLPVNGFNTSVAVPLDFDNDGDIDLFVGSRSVPGKYGLAPPCFIYENGGDGIFKNVTKKIASELQSLGMVTDALLSDITGDGQDELIIIGEWMAPQVFKTGKEKFEKIETNLSNFPGWWYTIESDDVDDDGDMDFILGNRGENFYFTGSPEQPAKLWVSDFDDNGTAEKIITRTINGKDMPIPLKRELTEQIVSLKKKFLKHAEYATKSIQDIFPEEAMEKAKVWEATYFQSAVALNEGNGNFTMNPLPKEVQFSCVCGIYCNDLNGDGKNDLMLAGNDSGFMPQFSKLDASFGHVLLNKGKGNFKRVDNRESGFYVRGDVKQLVEVSVNGKSYLLVMINDKKPKFFYLTGLETIDIR